MINIKDIQILTTHKSPENKNLRLILTHEKYSNINNIQILTTHRSPESKNLTHENVSNIKDIWILTTHKSPESKKLRWILTQNFPQFPDKYLENSGSVENVRVAHVHPGPPVLHEGEPHQSWDDGVRPGRVLGQCVQKRLDFYCTLLVRVLVKIWGRTWWWPSWHGILFTRPQYWWKYWWNFGEKRWLQSNLLVILMAWLIVIEKQLWGWFWKALTHWSWCWNWSWLS